jgi:hypothetical protein
MEVVEVPANEADMAAALANAGEVADDDDEPAGPADTTIELADAAHELAQQVEDQQPVDEAVADAVAVEVVAQILEHFDPKTDKPKPLTFECGADGFPSQFWTIVEKLFTKTLEGNEGSKIGIVVQQRCKLLLALEKDPFRDFPRGVELAKRKYMWLVKKHLKSEKLIVAASVMHVNGIDSTWPDTYPTNRYVKFSVIPWIEDHLKRVSSTGGAAQQVEGPSEEDERDLQIEAEMRGKVYEPRRQLTAIEQFRGFLTKKADGSIRAKQYDAIPAEWWRTIGRKEFPGVFGCAMMLLSFECTSVRVESGFSIMPCLQGLHRTSLMTRNLEALMIRLNARRIARLVLDAAAMKQLGWE